MTKRILLVTMALALALAAVGCGTETAQSGNTGYTPNATASSRAQNQTHTHSYGDWETIKEPTCESQGEYVRRCSCGTTENGYTDALGHKFGSWQTVKEATCETGGQKKRTCTRCGKEEYQETAASGNHNFGSWQTVKEATCETGGQKKRVCSRCRKEEYQTTEALGHSYSSNGKCYRCDKLDPSTPAAKCTLTINGLPVVCSEHNSYGYTPNQVRIDSVIDYGFFNRDNKAGLYIEVQGVILKKSSSSLCNWFKAKLSNGTSTYTNTGSFSGDVGDTGTATFRFYDLSPGNYTVTFVDYN